MKNQERTEVIDCSMFHLAEESEVVYKRFENLGGEFSKERKKMYPGFRVIEFICLVAP